MDQTRRSPLLAMIAGAALSLALFGCGSGGYKTPKNPPNQPPPTYPGGMSSTARPSDSTATASKTTGTSNVPSETVASH